MQRTLLTGLALVLLAVQACGSDDGKKAENPGEAGGGGEAGTESAGGAGGGSAGEAVAGSAGEPPAGGMGGAPTDGGMPGVAAGAGGEPEPEPPQPELLFAVRSGSQGLPGTAVRAQYGEGLEGTAIYATRSGAPDDINGSNELKVKGEALGLAPSDEIVSFALPQVEPDRAMYLFSVVDGSEGGFPTRVYESYSQDNDEEANLYYTDAVTSYRWLGEGGDEFGYNALLASEASLGLSAGLEGAADDLRGLAAHDARVPLTELYFTVASSAQGAEDSAVAAADAYVRGCTVFRSELDGTNTVAFSCEELGLAAGDSIDGLAVLREGATTRLVFSAGSGSSGLESTGVRDVVVNGGVVGATLFESSGDGTNAVHRQASELGLGAEGDDIDGFAITSTPTPSPVVASAGSCALVVDPLSEEGGGLSWFGGTSHLSNNVLLVVGGTATGSRILAYNATTCAFLQQQDLPAGFEESRLFAAVPLTGWSALTPLDNVEYVVLAPAGAVDALELRRHDAAGVFQVAVPILDTWASDEPAAVVYAPAQNRLFALVRRDWVYLTLLSMPRPGAAATELRPTMRDLTMPCPSRADVTGTDALGNLYLAEQNGLGDLRVCRFAPNGELLPLPYSWTSETTGTGFIVPGGSHYLFSMGGGAGIERSTPQ